MSDSEQSSAERNERPGSFPKARPDVIVELVFERGVFQLVVNNIGDQPALNVSIKFDQKLVGLGGSRDISGMALFKNIPFLGPKRQISTLLDSSDSYFAGKQPTRISAKITYTGDDQHKYEKTITHDLEIYRDITYFEPGDKNASSC